jgi:hypothetical protein
LAQDAHYYKKEEIERLPKNKDKQKTKPFIDEIPEDLHHDLGKLLKD